MNKQIEKSSSAHLKALLRKNWILWKRNRWVSLLEILLPAGIVAFMYIFRNGLTQTDVPETSYATPQLTFFASPHPIFPKKNELTTAFGTQLNFSLIQDCQHRLIGNSNRRPQRNGKVALVSDVTKPNFLIDTLEKELNQYGYATQRYKSETVLREYISSLDYEHDVCIGVASNITGNEYSYKLMYNTSGNGPLDDIPDTLNDLNWSIGRQAINQYLKLWKISGFLTLQNWIDNIILRKESGNPNAMIVPGVTSVQVAKHTNDQLAEILLGNFATYTVLPLILIYLRMTYGLLQEKEKKIREGMKIMGMKDSSFYLSWIIHYFLVYLVTSIVITFELKTSVFPNTDYSLLLVWFLLFCVALIFQSLFVTVFFTHAKLGNIVGMVFFLFQYMAEAFIRQGDATYETKRSISIIPHTAISLACDVFLLIENEQKGLTWDNIDIKLNNYSVGTCMYFCVINALVFGILAFYLDQVVPNEFGQKKHPLFFLDFLLKKKVPQSNMEKLHPDTTEQPENFEEVDATLLEQSKKGDTVKITNLSKVYSNGKLAVRNVNLEMYQGQIFVLLGHNGAGKTTTISMLNGFIEITAGKASIFNFDVEKEMQDIRKFMGVCPQHDILFDDLTVKEHLELFATFQGMEKSKIEAEVMQAIADVDLLEKKDARAKNLSGGQRRRLSVAIAFIGNSQIIFLDEPTSGMDTSARRYIWELLQKYQSNQIVVLTTHFMDEADYLGDRVGIMGDGQLICCGSTVFLQNRFGVGYNLTVVKASTMVDSKPIETAVTQFIPTAKEISNVSSEVAFQLPLESIANFGKLFEVLDSDKAQLGIQTYGVSITTLEEVFLRVASEEVEEVHHGGHQYEIEMDNLAEKEIDDFDLNTVRIPQGFKLFCVHWWALVVKRFISFSRDYRGLICQLLLPCAVILAGMSILLIKFVMSSPELALSPQLYKLPMAGYYGGADSLSDMQKIIGNLSPAAWDLKYLKTTNIGEWDNKNYVDRPENFLGSYWIFNADFTSKRFDYLAEVQTLWKDSAPILMNQMNEAIVNSVSSRQVSIQVALSPFPLTHDEQKIENTADGIIASFMFAIGLSFIPASMITFSVKEREERVKHQQLVSGVGILSYWTSNLFLDFFKALLPCIFGIGMVYAFDIGAFTETAKNQTIICLLFIFYAWSIVPFSYLFGFLFKSFGNAQVLGFFLHFILGGIGPMIVFVLRIISSTRDIGQALQWVLRLIPSFSFGYGVIQLGNLTLFAIIEGKQKPYEADGMDSSGADVVFMAVEGLVYFLLVFLVERLMQMGSITRLISGETSLQYVPKKYDIDVVREMQEVAKTHPQDYTVRVNKLRKVYNPEQGKYFCAVDRVSFGIRNGECFTLLGVNGAGKTTTFKILSGEINSTTGEAHIAGHNVATEMNKAMHYMGYCPQFDALLENLTAKEHLNLYAAIKGIPFELRQQLIEKKLVEMDLKKYENVCAGTYSGGNKRKLSVAIAMLGNPPIVFLDEPSTGMDPKARRFMWSVISRITTQRKRSSVILTTHSMEEAEALSTKMGIMVSGSMKCIGSVQHLKSKFGKGYEMEIKPKLPSHEEVRSFMNSKGLKIDSVVTVDNLNETLARLGAEHCAKEFSEHGSASGEYVQLKSTNGLNIETLAQYVINEERGKKALDFLRENISPNIQIIEHFQNFYRVKLEATVSIGKIFNLFEANQEKLGVASYSVQQATIEQIFNLFAENQIDIDNPVDEEDKLPEFSA